MDFMKSVTVHDLPRLTPPEQALYDDLRCHRLRPALRLKQEQVGFHWARHALGTHANNESMRRRSN